MAAGPYMTTKHFCEELHIDECTERRWRRDGESPPWIRLGKRLIVYRRADVEKWLAKRAYKNRADELSRKASLARKAG